MEPLTDIEDAIDGDASHGFSPGDSSARPVASAVRQPKSLTVNATMNLLNQASAVLFPLITFPYVSRVLQPEGLGRVSFAQAVVGYFAMIASLGIPLYGVREAARRRDDKVALSTLAAELFLLNGMMTLLALSGFGVFMLISTKAASDPRLFWICALPMLAVPLGFGWLFGGLEEYVYITLRSLAFRMVVLAAIFLFIQTQDDYRIYAMIVGLSAAGSEVLNLYFIRNLISWKTISLKSVHVLQHLKPVLVIFSLVGVISIYTSLDKVMLGYLTDDRQVGLYSAADRLVKVIVVLVTSMGVVLVPRLSYYVQQKRFTEYSRLANLSVRVLAFVSFPAAAALIVLARPVILLFCGSRFEPSSPLVQIMGINVVLIAFSSFIGYQVLYSQGKERLLVCSVLFGAVSNLILNWLLIPQWQAMGAAVATLVAEALVTGVQIVLARPYVRFTWPLTDIVKYFVTAASVALMAVLLSQSVSGAFACIAISLAMGGSLYFAAMWTFRDRTLRELLARYSSGSSA
ncbi:MAG: flippase [Rhodopirellula sp.]|nr:flippase [Rhodopirellula sp.]